MKTIMIIALSLMTLISYSQNMRGARIGMTTNQVTALEKTKGTLLTVDDGENRVYTNATYYGMKGHFRYQIENDTVVAIGFMPINSSLSESMIQNFIKNWGPVVDSEIDSDIPYMWIKFKNGMIITNVDDDIIILASH